MKTFVIGDIHGSSKALDQCLKRSDFNYNEDRLVVLGDVCDGFAQVDRCIDELLKIKHCVLIIGNHDRWALKWAESGWKENVWLTQGGRATIESYAVRGIPRSHIDFLKSALYYYEYKTSIFVHGGFDPQKPIAFQDKELFLWDRALITHAQQIDRINPDYKFSEYKEIYIGHTPTTKFDSTKPLKFCNVWDMDTAAGWGGRLSIMDIETKEFWQSDPTLELYPNSVPRR